MFKAERGKAISHIASSEERMRLGENIYKSENRRDHNAYQCNWPFFPKEGAYSKTSRLKQFGNKVLIYKDGFKKQWKIENRWEPFRGEVCESIDQGQVNYMKQIKETKIIRDYEADQYNK